MPASTILDIRSTLGSDSSSDDYETLGERIKKRAKVVLPHVGLVLLLVIYTLCGAGVFYFLERPNEISVRKTAVHQLREKRTILAETIRNLTFEHTGSLNSTNFTAVTEEKIKEFEVWLVKTFDKRHLTIDDLTGVHHDMWTLSAAVFFASTVITTIGYGHMAPMTFGGRLFCIGFGLFGIPLLLITIADIGKFLSDLITMLYRSYRMFKTRLRRKSKKISYILHTGRDPVPSSSNTQSSPSSYTAETDVNDMTIPVWVVLCFLSSYTAIGGFLFRVWEGWAYFDSFYFCFITMATIGFGDLVPTEETYMFLTMIYILIGLAVTTMCIDLAGTEYIRKIHYFGQKMENAKDLFGEGLQVGGEVLKQAHDLINVKNIAFLRSRGLIDEEMEDEMFQEQLLNYLGSDRLRANVLYEPVSPKVRRILKKGVNITPDEIQEGDAFILENKVYGKQIFPPPRTPGKIHALGSTKRRPKQDIMIASNVSGSWPRDPKSNAMPYIPCVAPFILHETNV